MKDLREMSVQSGMPVLVRAALNVPLENGIVANDYRLRRALATIQYLRARSAKIILISHIGEKGTETLRPVADSLRMLLGNVSFCDTTIGAAAREAIRTLPAGGVLVLENLRRDKGETANDAQFAKELSLLADAFVQDSFDTCHRLHASIVGVPSLLPSYAGMLLGEEVAALSKALAPEHPSLAVIGGAKFATKESVLASLVRAYDTVYVGGALANDFLKASGREVGASFVSGAPPEDVVALMKERHLMLPHDFIVIPKEVAGAPDARLRARVRSSEDIQPDEIILDIGPVSAARLAKLAAQAKTVLWNGPLGNYEHGFTDATNALAEAIAASSTQSFIGGGDTVAAIETLGIVSRFSFVSTGGGAMLDFLAYGTLPGIDALARSH